MEKITKGLIVVGVVILILALVIGLLGLQGLIVYWLWNWLAVGLFNAPVITYPMGMGIAFALNFIGGMFRSHTKVEK